MNPESFTDREDFPTPPELTAADRQFIYDLVSKSNEERANKFRDYVLAVDSGIQLVYAHRAATDTSALVQGVEVLQQTFKDFVEDGRRWRDEFKQAAEERILLIEARDDTDPWTVIHSCVTSSADALKSRFGLGLALIGIIFSTGWLISRIDDVGMDMNVGNGLFHIQLGRDLHSIKQVSEDRTKVETEPESSLPLWDSAGIGETAPLP